MNTDNIFFVAGLPRSGSTLIQNILAQNPYHHASPTNGLVDLLVKVRSYWTTDIAFRSQGIDVVKPRIIDSMRGQMYGFYQEEIDQGKIIFDKSRGWLQYIELMEEVLDRKVKVIVTVRDIKSMVASFEKINRKSQMTMFPPPNEQAYFNAQTIEGRANQILANGSVLGISINRLRDAYNRGLADRIILVPYQELTNNTKKTMKYIHEALELPNFKYNPKNVKQVTLEDDSVHGMELHTIKGKVEPAEEAPWEGVLPVSLCDMLDLKYEDINKLAELKVT